MKTDLNNTGALSALLRAVDSVDTPEAKSLCCAAAGITASISAPTEALIPHEKLREAATPDATLIAQDRPPAQPVEGYKPLLYSESSTTGSALEPIQIDERTEFEKEFPVPEGLRYCGQRGTYIYVPGANTSHTFARKHCAYRAGFAGWMRRSWTRAALDAARSGQDHLAMKTRKEEA